MANLNLLMLDGAAPAVLRVELGTLDTALHTTICAIRIHDTFEQ